MGNLFTFSILCMDFKPLCEPGFYFSVRFLHILSICHGVLSECFLDLLQDNGRNLATVLTLAYLMLFADMLINVHFPNQINK